MLFKFVVVSDSLYDRINRFMNIVQLPIIIQTFEQTLTSKDVYLLFQSMFPHGLSLVPIAGHCISNEDLYG